MDKALVSLITPTGTRPEALALCEKYLLRQTYTGPMQWIVVDDSPEQLIDDTKQPLEWEALRKASASKKTVARRNKGELTIEKYIGPKKWYPGINTQRPNMQEGISHVSGDFVFVIEDDDWYHQEYIETFVYLMQRYAVVGEGCNKYYSLRDRKYWTLGNHYHASLCSTAMKRMALPLLDEAINSGDLFPDISFWQKCIEKWKLPRLLALHLNLGIGIKQMPGRKGIGGGHSPNDTVFKSDPGYNILKEWVGADDAAIYVKIMQESLSK